MSGKDFLLVIKSGYMNQDKFLQFLLHTLSSTTFASHGTSKQSQKMNASFFFKKNTESQLSKHIDNSALLPLDCSLHN